MKRSCFPSRAWLRLHGTNCRLALGQRRSPDSEGIPESRKLDVFALDIQATFPITRQVEPTDSVQPNFSVGLARSLRKSTTMHRVFPGSSSPQNNATIRPSSFAGFGRYRDDRIALGKDCNGDFARSRNMAARDYRQGQVL